MDPGIALRIDAIRVPDISDRAVRNRIALRILRVSSGTQFDPELIQVLCSRCLSSLFDPVSP
jgi:hypothetical protein